MRAAFYVAGGLDHGTGHLYRCQALASGLSDDNSIFLVDQDKTGLLGLCSDLGVACLPVTGDSSDRARAESVNRRVQELDVDVLVLDLFEVDQAYLRQLKSSVRDRPLVALDDYSITRPIPDVVIKPHLVREWYTPDASWDGTTLLTGPDYWILRPQLRELAGRQRRVSEHAETVLVTLGGSDPRQVTRSVVDVLGSGETVVPHLQVICGPGYPDLDSLREVVHEVSKGSEIEVLRTPDDFGRLMFECDLAVTAGGYTIYELAALGTPMVILPWVEHQTRHARAMEARGAAVSMGLVDGSDLGPLRSTVTELLLDPERRNSMSSAGRSTVDGRGVERVANLLRRMA